MESLVQHEEDLSFYITHFPPNRYLNLLQNTIKEAPDNLTLAIIQDSRYQQDGVLQHKILELFVIICFTASNTNGLVDNWFYHDQRNSRIPAGFISKVHKSNFEKELLASVNVAFICIT